MVLPATQNQNNYTDIVLIKTLLGSLALASYCLTLILISFNLYIATWQWLTGKDSACLTLVAPWCLSGSTLLSSSIQFYLPCLPKYY